MILPVLFTYVPITLYCPNKMQDTATMGKHLQWVWPDWLLLGALLTALKTTRVISFQQTGKTS